MYRYKLRCAVLAICATAGVATRAHADGATDSAAANSLVKAFTSICVQSMAHLDQVETTAASRGWKKSDGLEGPRFAAPSPRATSTTWTVEGEADVPFWLVITHGTTEHGKVISVCTVANASVPSRQVKAALVDTLDLKYPIQREHVDSRQETYWNASFEGTSLVVSLSEAASSSETGVNVSVTLIQNAP